MQACPWPVPGPPGVRPLERGVFVAVATDLTGGARPQKVAPQPRVDYAVREAQRSGRAAAVGPRHLRAVPRRLAAHLVPQTTVAQSRRAEPGLALWPSASQAAFPCPNGHSGGTAYRLEAAYHYADRLSLVRSHSIGIALRHTRGCPADPCPMLSFGVFTMLMPKRIQIATASHPNVGGARYGHPFFALVVPAADERRLPALPRQALRIRVRGANDLFVSDGIRGHKRSTTT